MRTSKNNLDSCKQYIRNLIANKFEFLLNHNESNIKIKHLLKIPLVDPIVMNASMMPSYFSKGNGSKFIGIDRETGNGFLSFWIKKLTIEWTYCRIITILFNRTNTHRIYYSDPFESLSFLDPTSAHSHVLELDFNHSNSDDIKGINTLLLNKNTKWMLVCDRNKDWCLNELWESCMFWVNVRDCLTRPRISAREYTCLAVTLSTAAWLLMVVLLCLTHLI